MAVVRLGYGVQRTALVAWLRPLCLPLLVRRLRGWGFCHPSLLGGSLLLRLFLPSWSSRASTRAWRLRMRAVNFPTRASMASSPCT